jgi:hypothetical protein
MFQTYLPAGQSEACQAHWQALAIFASGDDLARSIIIWILIFMLLADELAPTTLLMDLEALDDDTAHAEAEKWLDEDEATTESDTALPRGNSALDMAALDRMLNAGLYSTQNALGLLSSAACHAAICCTLQSEHLRLEYCQPDRLCTISGQNHKCG